MNNADTIKETVVNQSIMATHLPCDSFWRHESQSAGERVGQAHGTELSCNAKVSDLGQFRSYVQVHESCVANIKSRCTCDVE